MLASPMLEAARTTVISVSAEAESSAYEWVLRVLEREGPGILTLLRRLLGSEADVLDAYQDCFCRLARCNVRSVRNTRAYVYRTASNIAIEMIRSRRRDGAHRAAIAAVQRSAAEDDRKGVGAESQWKDARTALQDAIAELPEYLRNVVVLRDLGRLSYDQVGKILSIDPATARVYRRHAVVKLSERLGAGIQP